jgi:hypothetical protein
MEIRANKNVGADIQVGPSAKLNRTHLKQHKPAQAEEPVSQLFVSTITGWFNRNSNRVSGLR